MQCFFYIDGGDLCGEPATYIQSPTVVGKEITRLSCAIVNYFFAQKKKNRKKRQTSSLPHVSTRILAETFNKGTKCLE